MEDRNLAAQAVEGNDAAHYTQILKVTYWLVDPSSNRIFKHFDHEYLKSCNIKNGDWVNKTCIVF